MLKKMVFSWGGWCLYLLGHLLVQSSFSKMLEQVNSQEYEKMIEPCSPSPVQNRVLFQIWQWEGNAVANAETLCGQPHQVFKGQTSSKSFPQCQSGIVWLVGNTGQYYALAIVIKHLCKVKYVPKTVFRRSHPFKYLQTFVPGPHGSGRVPKLAEKKTLGGLEVRK